MSRMLAIVRRDVASAFSSPVAYVVMGAFALIIGVMFMTFLGYYQMASQQMLAQSFGSPEADDLLAEINVVDLIVMPLFGNATVILLLVIPTITMRLLAEEKKSGTDELLFTAPITVNDIIVGKFLAGSVILLAVMATTLVPMGALFMFGNPPIKTILCAYLGLFLLGATCLAVGLLTSSLTENQIIAAVLGFGSLLILFVIGWAGEQLGGTSTAGKLLAYLSLTNHFEDFTKGIIDSVHVIYYLSMTFLSLFATARIVESRRWR